jgi:hypothetical protein
MKSITFVFLLSILLFAACKQENKYDSLAKDLCTCMRPMAELQQKFMKLAEEGNQEGAMALMSEAMAADSIGQACLQNLEKTHGIVEGEDEEAKAMEALKKACPDVVAIMEQSAAPQMPPMEELEGLMPDSTGAQEE